MRSVKRDIDIIINSFIDIVDDNEQIRHLVVSWLLCQRALNKKVDLYYGVLRDYVFNHPLLK